MEIDFSALASRVAAFGDVLGCIILSTDGLVLGAFPPADGDGDGIKRAWLRFAAVGEPERGFLKIDGQVWAYVSVGAYAAFAVATDETRPGVLLDHLEQALAVAGESRDQLRVARAPERVELVAGTKPKAVAEKPPRPYQIGSALDLFQAAAQQPEQPSSSDPGETSADSTDKHHPPEGEPEHERGEGAEVPDEGEIDPIALAREFAGLLQEDRRGDENNQ